MASAKLNNSSLITPASHFSSGVANLCLSPFNILVIMLLVLLKLSAVVVIAAPMSPEIQWTAVVIPITWSPNTVHQDRISTQPEPFQKFWNSIASGYPSRNKLAWTVTKSSPLYSTCHGFSCYGEDLSKNHDDKSRLNAKQRDKNQHEKNKCGQNRHDKHCGKDQHWEHCSKNQCNNPFGRDRHEKHCAKNRNDRGRHDINCRNQNKEQKIKNGNKHRKFIVDNKVIVNFNNDQPIKTPSPSLLQVETTVPVPVSSTTYGSVKQNSNLSIFEICLLMYCIFFLIAFCIMRA